MTYTRKEVGKMFLKWYTIIMSNSKAMKELWANPEYRKRVSKAMSKGRKGIVFSDEHKRNMSIAGKGNSNSGSGKENKSYKHGLSQHRLANVWYGMISRCQGKNHPGYKRYGGRGITVCDRWLNINNFIEDMDDTYQDGLLIERINNDGNYHPSNCKWATRKEQANNRRSNRLLTFRGETLNIKQWADKLGLDYRVLRARVSDYGWSSEKALTIKIRGGEND